MRAGAELDVLLAVLHPVHDRDIGGDAEIAGDVEHPDPASVIGELALDVTDIGIVEFAEVDFRAPQTVVPPDRVGIALNQFEKTLDDRFLAGIAGGTTVGVGVEVLVEEIEQAGRKIFEALIAQRPDRRPLDLRRGIDWIGNGVRTVRLRLIPARKLRFAEVLDIVGEHGLAIGEIGEAAACGPDLVALEDSGVSLDRLHQRARFGLFGGRSFAGAAAVQSRAELIDAHGRRGEIMMGEEVGVERQIAVHLLELGHHAGQRTDMLAIARHGLARGHRTIAAAGHDQPCAGADLDRLRRALRVLQLLVAADRALRAVRHEMLGDGRAHQVEACDVIAQIGAESGRDRFRDFDGGELDRALPKRTLRPAATPQRCAPRHDRGNP